MSAFGKKLLYTLSVSILTFGIFLGLFGWQLSLTEMNHQEGFNFMWQIVLFGFLIGIGTLSIDSSLLHKRQKDVLSFLGMCTILSGLLLIISFGVVFASIKFLHISFIAKASIFVMIDGGIGLMSLAIAATAVELLKIIWPRLKKIFLMP